MGNALGFTSDGVPPDTRNGTYWGGYEENVGPYLPSGTQDLSVYQRERTWTMRYTPRKFYGNLIVHCHILDHEDIGMMSLEYILPQRNATCMCDYNADLPPRTRRGSAPAASSAWGRARTEVVATGSIPSTATCAATWVDINLDRGAYIEPHVRTGSKYMNLFIK